MDKPSYKQLYTVLEESALFQKPPNFRRASIYKTWRQVAGTSIADNTIDLKIDGDVLHVAVNSPTWAHELINQQNSILLHLRDSGYDQLTEMSIRIRVANSRSVPKPRKKIRNSRTSTPELQNLFARLASESTDPDTKETFLRLSRKSVND